MSLRQYTKEFKYNISLATPVVMGLLGHTMVAFIDNVMVGRLGVTELAAISLANSFVFVSMALIIGFSMVITPMVAEYDSYGNHTGSRSALKNGLVLCLFNGFVLVLLSFLTKPIMYHMGQPQDVVIMASPFLDLIIVSLILLSLFQGFKQFTDGLHRTSYAMYATFLGNIVNVILNYLLIFGKFGFPQMGIVGAGIGTLISRGIMVLYMWLLIYNHRDFAHRYRIQLNKHYVQWTMIIKMLKLGIPSAMQMLFEVVLFTSSIWLSGVLGKNSQAANQIALNLSSITFMVTMGLSTTSMIRIANQKGLNKFEDLRRIALSIFLLTLIIDIIFATIFLIFHNHLPHLYLDELNNPTNGEVVIIASKLLLVAALFQISDGIQVVVLGALRGLQDIRIPTIITFISYWLVGFSVAFYLSLYTSLGAVGIWYGLLSGLTTAAVLLYIRFNHLTKIKL